MMDVKMDKKLEYLLQDFRKHYADVNYGLAADVAEEALDQFPLETYRYFVAHESAPWIKVLNRTGRIDNTASLLDKLFDRVPLLNLACDDPGQIDHMVQLREEKIQQGLRSPLLVTQGKSGSVTLATIFSEGFNLPCFTYSLINMKVIPNWAKDYSRGGACYVTHLEPSKSNIAALKASGNSRVIVHTRDPRQILISVVHHFIRYPEQIPEYASDDYKQLGIIEKIDWILQNGDYYQHIDWIERWVDAANELEIHFSTFEQFRENPDAVIEGYLQFYGGDLKYFQREKVFVRNEGTDYHFRLGEVDEWRKVMTDTQIDRVNGTLSSKLRKKFSWS
jgi:hypothetical protein